ncbi:MAG: ankyrin repeat domain-containing protein [Actinophytocola sp.]|uniref:ankyrin repeat domain-containing protein n=1 Tax=Actinophytocola sp. TaxID=1872138 RepID=UPI003D6AC9F9
MTNLGSEEPLAVSVTSAIRTGNLDGLRALLTAHPILASARIVDDKGHGRSLLHVVTDWPGHFPRGTETVAMLVAAGADVHARFVGPHLETPLHWAASCDDVAVLDALLDAGAHIDAPGAVIGGGPPLADATAFAQWAAAFRLVERGATTTLFTAAALGLTDRVRPWLGPPRPAQDDLDAAFWGACHGGRQETAELLATRGARINWVAPWEPMTPLDAAHRGKATDLVRWLRSRGARPAAELTR